jgi:hypothetical protein
MRPELFHLEHLSSADLEFIWETVAPRGDPRRGLSFLSQEPELVERLLDDERLFRRLSPWLEEGRTPGEREIRPGNASPLVRLTPYFLFQILLRQARRELGSASYTVEWAGSRQRVPVFDAPVLFRALEDPLRLAYLAELLASFSRVQGATVWYRQGGRLRKLRVHEMDPASLEKLLELSAPEDRFFLCRRLGDSVLFLAGIFADHVGRAAHGPTPVLPFLPSLPPGLAAIEALDEKGRHYYHLAAEHPRARPSGLQSLLESLAGEFRQVRRVLNYLGDRYINRFRQSWFHPAA